MANTLKAGTVSDFANSLAAYFDTAMQNEWQATNGTALPNDDQSKTQRRVMFAAIAQGLLKFLDDHLDDLVTTEVSGDGGTSTHHHAMNFSVGTYREPLP